MQTLTQEDARLLTQRRGSFLFYAELNHRKKVLEARAEGRRLRDELKASGVNPDQVIFESQLERQKPVRN